MSKIGDHIINLQEIPVLMDCPSCGGAGEVEVDTYVSRGFGRDVGEIYSSKEVCEECLGNGEVYKPCCGCGETLTLWDGKDAQTCRECREGT
jgi:hypothetical protein